MGRVHSVGRCVVRGTRRGASAAKTIPCGETISPQCLSGFVPDGACALCRPVRSSRHSAPIAIGAPAAKTIGAGGGVSACLYSRFRTSRPNTANFGLFYVMLSYRFRTNLIRADGTIAPCRRVRSSRHSAPIAFGAPAAKTFGAGGGVSAPCLRGFGRLDRHPEPVSGPRTSDLSMEC
jgi:hypothetical protein